MEFDNYIGLLLSMILTLIPFFLVMLSCFKNMIVVVIFFCLLQIIVHFRYFFQFNINNYDIWFIIFMIFTLIVILIIICGSIWIMYNLHHNLM
ncbi:MAG: cytochrome o ubiquinol oxidase subunit IV [Buchnera aphidicola (Eriosoma harunire)]